MKVVVVDRQEQGFSLVELLVALVVASIGLLGVATLSLQATRYNFDAKLRNQATILASDMADRIRLNPDNAVSNYLAAIALTPATNNNCDSSACTDAERAEQDVFEWLQAVSTQLPGGVGLITNPGAGAELEVTVQWNEVGGDFVSNRNAPANTVQRDVAVSVLP